VFFCVCFSVYVFRLFLFFVFFFQAEDGIRDGHVTGVQTCALPISFTGSSPKRSSRSSRRPSACWLAATRERRACATSSGKSPLRSEERRVGKECRSRGAPDQ